MQGTRIVGMLNESWGQATIYTHEPIKDDQLLTKDRIRTELMDTISETVITTTFIEDDPTKSDTELNNDDGDNSLSYMLASIFATTLEDGLTQLRILVECNSELKIIKTMSDMGLLLALKYGVSQPKLVDELDSIDLKNLNCDEYKIYKLDSDRNVVIKTILETYVDLSINRSFKPIKKCINDIINGDVYRITIQEDEIRNKILRRELYKQLRQQRNHAKSLIYDTDVTINELKTQVEDSVLMSECRSRYVDGWQRARNEQHIQSITEIESVPNEQVDYYKQRSDHEQRVHSEVELLVNISINETLERIESWMDKYDKDMEKIDLKIQIQKNDYQNMLDKRVNLEDTIEKHDQLMKEWIHFKEEREKARMYREKMTKSAVIVQAWWRGLLVRRQLGPYKVVQKKGGKKK